MPKKFISIGESMVELQSASNGLYKLGFAGDTLNTAWYVRALTQPKNVSVEYFTAIGSDQLSQEMKAFLDVNGIGTTHITQIHDRTVGLYLITLTEAERSFTYWRSHSAARLFAEDEAHLRAALSDTDCIYFSGITLAILSPERRTVFLAILSERKLAGATIAFDTNSRRRLWSSEAEMQTAMIDGYKVSTLALPTFDDEQALWGDAQPTATADRLQGFGVTEIVVKNGADGALVRFEGRDHLVPCPAAVQPVDTTAAGDSFNAGYLAQRLAGCESGAAALQGHRLAGVVIQHRGAIVPRAATAAIVGAS